MTTIPDLIDNWRKRRLDGDLSFGVLVDETIDLLTRLTAPGDEGLETTEDDLIALEELERDEYLKGVDIANIGKLLRDFDLLRAKLRAAEERIAASGDDGLNVTEDELNDLLTVVERPKDKAEDFFLRLGRSVQFLSAKLRAAEARAASYEAALKAVAFGSYSNVSVDSDGSLELAQIASRMQEIARAALNPEAKP
jgi:hypothetical protein